MRSRVTLPLLKFLYPPCPTHALPSHLPNIACAVARLPAVREPAAQPATPAAPAAARAAQPTQPGQLGVH